MTFFARRSDLILAAVIGMAIAAARDVRHQHILGMLRGLGLVATRALLGGVRGMAEGGVRQYGTVILQHDRRNAEGQVGIAGLVDDVAVTADAFIEDLVDDERGLLVGPRQCNAPAASSVLR